MVLQKKPGRRSCCGAGDSPTKKPRGNDRRSAAEIGREAIDLIGGEAALSKNIPGEEELAAQSRRYHALSDPLRLTILCILKDQPLCVCVINRFMRISGSKLSYHLSILKESGLIDGEYQGNWIIYAITETGKKYVE